MKKTVFFLIFTVLMFLWAITSGYDSESLGLIAIVFGAAYAIAVDIGSRMAPKIGYWNVLAVPLIQVTLVFILFSAVSGFS